MWVSPPSTIAWKFFQGRKLGKHKLTSLVSTSQIYCLMAKGWKKPIFVYVVQLFTYFREDMKASLTSLTVIKQYAKLN